jgi:RNA polymerase sigma factor (TIGR02999 family)
MACADSLGAPEKRLDPEPGEITLLLHRWENGESTAFDRLVPLVYPHLREVAAAYIGRERNPGVLQATALVHELYLRLLHQKKADWNDRSHFYTFAAKVMRMILTDHARANQAKKRGGTDHRVPLNDEIPWISIGGGEMVELNRALDELETVDAGKVQILELRYFLGCTSDETADILNISKATVDRDVKFAKSWLYRRLSPPNTQNTAEL